MTSGPGGSYLNESYLSVGLEVLLQLAAGLELDDLLSWDDDLLLGLRVASLALATLGYAECAEAYEGYFAVLRIFESLSCCLNESVEGFLGIGFRKAGFFCDLVD